jgi:hypothetical protein
MVRRDRSARRHGIRAGTATTDARRLQVALRSAVVEDRLEPGVTTPGNRRSSMRRVGRQREWAPNRAAAIASRVAAVVLPPAVAVGVATILLRARPNATPHWSFAWVVGTVACCGLAAFACEPAARRLWTLSILYDLHTRFPSEPPSRLHVAVRARRARTLQRRLVESARANPSDLLTTTRMATAAGLAAVRIRRVRHVDRRRTTSSVLLAAGCGLGALLLTVGLPAGRVRQTATPTFPPRSSTSVPATTTPEQAAPPSGSPSPAPGGAATGGASGTGLGGEPGGPGASEAVGEVALPAARRQPTTITFDTPAAPTPPSPQAERSAPPAPAAHSSSPSVAPPVPASTSSDAPVGVSVGAPLDVSVEVEMSASLRTAALPSDATIVAEDPAAGTISTALAPVAFSEPVVAEQAITPPTADDTTPIARADGSPAPDEVPTSAADSDASRDASCDAAVEVDAPG